MSAPPPPVPNEATLRVSEPRFLGPVLGRVVGMLAARAQAPIDRLDDALLLTDAVAAHAPAHAADGVLEIHVATDPTGLRLSIRALREGGGAQLLDDAALPGVGNVLRRVADEVTAEGHALHLSLAFRTP